MQISALNTIIAAQQARNAQPARAAATVQPPAAKPASAFEPLAFAQPETDPTAAPPRPAYSASAPLGSQVDIRI